MSRYQEDSEEEEVQPKVALDEVMDNFDNYKKPQKMSSYKPDQNPISDEVTPFPYPHN